MINESVIRILLAYIRSVKYVEAHELEEKLGIIFSELEIEPVALTDVIDSINHGIQLTGFRVEKCLNESTNELTYSFVNSSRDSPVNKELTGFKMSEIETIKRIIDEIFLSNYYTEYEELLNHLIIDHKINKSSNDLRALINRLVALGYLEVASGNVIASIRLLLELKHFLNDKYDLIKCNNCDNVITRGVKYHGTNFHYKCFEIWKQQNSVIDNEVEKIGLVI